jgi:alkanesulfonate monooxygenase SsuD/methylene tetrahydromethanopterin reductase-like flavin-dependent oxidoreductase (luciferase family)
VPDFGHDLRFSTFPDPAYRPGHGPVELAVLSEQWGYDLVMFQDHPYMPAHLDVLTLLSWVAAQTTRIHVAPNVLNMAVRSPAIVAKSAASIDLLSGGRFELGLGAGLLWDEIEAMGVPRRTHGQAITALSEAIDVIRAIWNTAGNQPVRASGSYHHVDGMKPGPAPAHDMPLRLGAYKPRMLRLAGRKADGWAALLGRVQTRAQWQAASAIIDEAAAEAGRNPADIRRIAGITGDFNGTNGSYLQGPPGQWVEQLLPSAIEDGVGTFIIVTEDRPTLQRFAGEVIPALRPAVASERARPARRSP